MTLKFALVPGYVALIKHLKEALIRRGDRGPGSTDLPNMALAACSERVEAILITGECNRDHSLGLATALAEVFDPDTLVLALETFHEREDPAAGPRAPGELQRRHESGEDIGQAVAVLAAAKDGSVRGTRLCYRHQPAAGVPFGWTDVVEHEPEQLGGRVVDHLRWAATGGGGLLERHRRELDAMADELGVPPEARRGHVINGFREAVAESGGLLLLHDELHRAGEAWGPSGN